jgi:hypothetical protein
MGVRILYDERQDLACLYCSTSGWAFGPVVGPYELDRHDPDHQTDPVEILEQFLRWLREADYVPRREDIILGWSGDPRELTPAGLERAWGEFLVAQDRGRTCSGGAEAQGR